MITGVAHSDASIVSVIPMLLAVAPVTYKGAVPLGTLVDHPLLKPVRVFVLKLYVDVVLGLLGV